MIFAHGSGSSRHSPRNRFVAEVLHRAGLATLLVDLLTAEEDRRDAVTAEYRFDIGLLGRSAVGRDRLADADRGEHDFRYGYFGASTGAAAALVAATRPAESRGNRLAGWSARSGRQTSAARPRRNVAPGRWTGRTSRLI